MKFAVVDGCPCPSSIAPYVYLVLRRAGQTASSIYRGEDAKAILHRHGKHTQAEIHRMFPGISNPPNTSQHELRDSQGRRISEYEVGVDSGTNDRSAKLRINAAAKDYGWEVEHPYKRGVEGHHWHFTKRPKPKGAKQRAQVIALRARLAVTR